MSFFSILFPDGNAALHCEEPECFRDLNLDQIVKAVTSYWPDYDLAPFFYTALRDLDTVAYRQEVMLELENPQIVSLIKSFAQGMRAMREHLDHANKFSYPHEKARWFLGAVECYCDAVETLSHCLRDLELKSRGMTTFSDFLHHYVQSENFLRLAREMRQLTSDLASIHYSLLIHEGRVTVAPLENVLDYSAAVEDTFQKFRCGEVKDYRHSFNEWVGMNHIEAQILDRVALLNVETFNAVKQFSIDAMTFQEPIIVRFEREIHFYLAYLDLIGRCQRVGLSFCYPELSSTSKAVLGREVFDLALAHKRITENAMVVSNRFELRDAERIFFVSGANQGGKTTFARTFGQLHYLASLGCPVPGTEAKLFLFDRIFVHFEREEDLVNLRGKLEDDLVRMRLILEQATSDSIIIINEIFASTALKDALFLGEKLLEGLSELDVLCVCVSFMVELASFNHKTVSMVSMVDPDDPVLRTFQLERQPANGLAYALALAHKYHVTNDWLQKRIPG